MNEPKPTPLPSVLSRQDPRQDPRQIPPQIPPQLPMIVITGYLGAGKTTFINRLLSSSHGLRITVLVNDFGAVSLDEKLILNQDGDIIALANGCMCCQIGGDLYRTIDRILEKRSLIDYLVVETSGVADPAKIANIAVAEPDLILNSILTLVDAVHFDALIGEEMLADTLQRQIAAANLLLLTKSEMVKKEDLEQVKFLLSQIGENTEILIEPDEVLDRIFIQDSMADAVPSPPVSYKLETHNVPFESYSWQGEAKIDRDRIIAFLRDPSLGIFRSKAIVQFSDGQLASIQKVGEIIEFEQNQSDPILRSITFIGVSKVFDKAVCEDRWNALVGEGAE